MTEQTVLWLLSAVLIPTVAVLWKVSRDEATKFRSFLLDLLHEDRQARAEMREQSDVNQAAWRTELAAQTKVAAEHNEVSRRIMEQEALELDGIREIAERLRQLNGGRHG